MADAPAQCAGEAREGLDEIRSAQWTAAQQALAADPGSEVWLGFDPVLSVDDVADLPGSLTVHGVQLVYEQQQGTYVKAQQDIPAVRADDPAFADAARSVLAESDLGLPPVSMPGIAEDALEPTDPSIRGGAPPIAALLVSGDVAAVLDDDPCLVHSMAPGGLADPPSVSPAIEPDVVPIDAG